MDIDMSALRLLEREREIPLDLLIPTIEQALLVAYHKTPGAFEKARAELDRKSGHVTIWATEIDDDGEAIGEFEDTPAGFGRIAASTARKSTRLNSSHVEISYAVFCLKKKKNR